MCRRNSITEGVRDIGDLTTEEDDGPHGGKGLTSTPSSDVGP